MRPGAAQAISAFASALATRSERGVAGMKIVTLLPSATDIVCALGQEQSLVGVSHSCKLPDSVQGVPVMTSTRVPHKDSSRTIDSFVRDHLAENDALYDLNLQALAAAAPDVIVSQALCDVCAVSTGDVIDALCSLPSSPVLIDLEPNTLGDVLDDCRRVGKALGCPQIILEPDANLAIWVSNVGGGTGEVLIKNETLINTDTGDSSAVSINAIGAGNLIIDKKTHVCATIVAPARQLYVKDQSHLYGGLFAGSIKVE